MDACINLVNEVAVNSGLIAQLLLIQLTLTLGLDPSRRLFRRALLDNGHVPCSGAAGSRFLVLSVINIQIMTALIVPNISGVLARRCSCSSTDVR